MKERRLAIASPSAEHGKQLAAKLICYILMQDQSRQDSFKTGDTFLGAVSPCPSLKSHMPSEGQIVANH